MPIVKKQFTRETPGMPPHPVGPEMASRGRTYSTVSLPDSSPMLTSSPYHIIGITQSFSELCSHYLCLTAIKHFAHLPSQGQEHLIVSLGRGFNILLTNLSEGSGDE